MTPIETVQALVNLASQLSQKFGFTADRAGEVAATINAGRSLLAQMQASGAPSAVRMLTEQEVRTLMNSMFGKSPRDLPAAIQRAFAAANNLNLKD